MAEQYKGQMFLGYANGVAAKIREIFQVMGGGETILEYGSLLGDAYYGVSDMIQEYLVSIGVKIEGDEFDNLVTEIMFAGRDEIYNIIKKYWG